MTAWEPPHRFAAESRDLGPDAPADRHGVDRRGALRRHLRRARGAQPVREHRRLGRSARGLRVRLAQVLPHPAAVPHPLPRPALLGLSSHGRCPRARGRGLGGADRSARPRGRQRGRAAEHARRRAAARRAGRTAGRRRASPRLLLRLDEPAPGIVSSFRAAPWAARSTS